VFHGIYLNQAAARICLRGGWKLLKFNAVLRRPGPVHSAARITRYGPDFSARFWHSKRRAELSSLESVQV
jgi:hypothetical protein